ncbi:MAG: beta-eliminating lyase-related protein [Terricaulis sp.]
MNFRSDNTAAVAPEILAALSEVNDGAAPSYGEDAWSRQLDDTFSQLFEREVRVFTVASGTAANAIALASLTPQWGAIFCHRDAHIEVDEAGAPQFYSGAKLTVLDGADAKIDAETLRRAAARRDVHASMPAAVSVSQATERGAVYNPVELGALSAAARGLGLKMHMDGARFANAVAALGCAPADITWRAGIHALSFGATKNGAMSAEAIVLFDLSRTEAIEKLRKRGGHLMCKGRYPAAQMLAYLKDGLWLRLAGRANALARRIAEAAGPTLNNSADANIVIVKVGDDGLAALRKAGVAFYEWGPGEARLVIAWNQDERDVDALCALLAKLR